MLEEFLKWLNANWFNLAQTTGIVASLIFSGLAAKREIVSRKLSNYLTMTQYHREIWKISIEKPELRRILNSDVNLETEPVTEDEYQFVHFLILHLSCSIELAKRDGIVDIEGIKSDASYFFGLPIPRHVWAQTRRLQNKSLIEFIDSAIPQTTAFESINIPISS